MRAAEGSVRSQAWALPAAWLVLVAISGPILIDFARHLTVSSWAWYALAFPPLTFLAVRSNPPVEPRIAGAFGLALVGMSIETVALASGALRVGRVGFVICVAALLLLQGRLRARTTVLLALCVPLPHALMEVGARSILPRLAEWLATLSRWAGTPALAIEGEIERPTGILELQSDDVGWTAAALAFGLAWFVCTRRRIAPLPSVGRSIAAGALGTFVFLAWTIALFHFAPDADPIALRRVRDGVVYVAILAAAAAFIRSSARPPAASAP